MEIHKEKHLFNKLLRTDGTVFREYIETTSANGVAKVFAKEYCILRRLFWLVVILACAAICLANCSERIRFLISGPTSTTTTIARKRPLVFPAVTICNLNYYTASGLEEYGLLGNAAMLLNTSPVDLSDFQHCENHISSNPLASSILFEDLNQNAVQPLSEFIWNCTYLGKPCDLERDFAPSMLGVGTCFTFNGIARDSSLETNGTGSHQGLLLYLNINQDEYTASGLHDAGVRVSIHPWNEPSQALDQGISIPPGRFAFISLREEDIINKAEVDCIRNNKVDGLNFLSTIYDYSTAACLTDCVYTAIADRCNCYHLSATYPPYNEKYAFTRDCTVSDTCCIQEVLDSPVDCDCQSACNTTFYDYSVSYSSVLANYAKQSLDNSLNSEVETNLIGLSVFFDSLNVKKAVTTFAYNPVALLSDIGGLLGLYLGISVITVVEFFTWMIDECVSRICCFRVSWKKNIKSQTAEDKNGNMESNIDNSVTFE